MFFLPLINASYLILFLAAVIPPIALLLYIYRQDKIEKEPKSMILRLFVFGALTTIPAGILESILGALLDVVFIGNSWVIYNIIFYFVIVAGSEEMVKHFALRKGSWNSYEFDYRFDAIVYSVAVTLGFAAAENIGYVFLYGMGNALLRAFTSIPGHCIFGIYMGYYYGLSKLMANHGDVPAAKRYQRMSLLDPVILHGLYDFFATAPYAIFTYVFFAFIIGLEVVAFNFVRKMSAMDEHL